MKSVKKISFLLCISFALVFATGFAPELRAAEEKKEEAPPKISNDKYDDIALFGRVINFIEKQYVEKVKTRDLVYGAIKGMLDTLDPHSNFMPPEIYNQLRSDTSGKFGGLGLEVWVNRDGILTVVNPMEGTPAWSAGIKSGDKIMRINGDPTKGMSLVEALSKMRGDPGSKITFSIQRDGVKGLLEFKVKRAIIDIKSVKSEMLADHVGYIKLNHFQEKSASEMKSSLVRMEEKGKLKGLILDLRNNPGGLLDQAVEVANIFIDSGVIVSTIGRDKQDKDVKSAKSGIARTDLPLMVLVNGNTASAAEIVAGAIKDHKRGILLGTRTFGKGSVQTVIPLAEDVGLKLTIARYYTPNGTSIQAKGIEPDIILDELDAESYKKLRKKARNVMREADLKNHFDNEGDDRKLGEKESSEEDVAEKAASKDELPKPTEPKDDYQVQQTLNYMKSFEIFRENASASGKVLSATDAGPAATPKAKKKSKTK